jgi:hypothetical protein
MPIEPFEKRRMEHSGIEAVLVAVTIRAVPGSVLRAEFDTFLFARARAISLGTDLAVVT